MFSQVISRIHLTGRQFFQGRYLVVTNTLGGGFLMALGDCLQQSREMHAEAGRTRNWKRTGEKRVKMEERTWRDLVAFYSTLLWQEEDKNLSLITSETSFSLCCRVSSKSSLKYFKWYLKLLNLLTKTKTVAAKFEISGKFLGQFSPNISVPAERFHVFGRVLYGFHWALLVPVAGPNVCWKKYESSGKEGSGRPNHLCTWNWIVVFYG